MFSFVWPIDDSGKPFTLQTRQPAIIEKRKQGKAVFDIWSVIFNTTPNIDKMYNDVKGTSLYENKTKYFMHRLL